MLSQHEPGATPAPNEALWLSLNGCARCHGDGHGLLFEPLTYQLEIGLNVLTHWATCPETGEPILLRITSDDDDDDRLEELADLLAAKCERHPEISVRDAVRTAVADTSLVLEGSLTLEDFREKP